MPLTTRCPGCGSTFRIDVPMLERAAGQVRCGRCGILFNAGDHLGFKPEKPAPEVDVCIGEEPAPQPDAAPTARESEPPAAATVPDTVDAPGEAAAGPAPSPGSAPQDCGPAAAGQPQQEPQGLPTQDPAAEPSVSEAEIAFARSQQQRASARRAGSALCGAASLVLLAVLGAEAALWAHAEFPGKYAQAERISALVCPHLAGHCPDALLRQAAKLELLSAALLATDTPNVYEYELTIRNHGSRASAMPSAALTLKDSSGKVTVRRVFAPAELGYEEPIAAGMDRAVRLRFTMPGAAPAEHSTQLFFP